MCAYVTVSWQRVRCALTVNNFLPKDSKYSYMHASIRTFLHKYECVFLYGYIICKIVVGLIDTVLVVDKYLN